MQPYQEAWQQAHITTSGLAITWQSFSALNLSAPYTVNDADAARLMHAESQLLKTVERAFSKRPPMSSEDSRNAPAI